MNDPDARIEPIELARLRRLAENPAIATLSDEHVAAIRWAVEQLRGDRHEYRIAASYPGGHWQAWPVAGEAEAATEFVAALAEARPDVEVQIQRRRLRRWETVAAAKRRKSP